MNVSTQLLAKLDAQAATLGTALPSKSDVQDLIDGLFDFLFPIHGQSRSKRLNHLEMLVEKFTRLSKSVLREPEAESGAEPEAEATDIVGQFFVYLPELHERMLEDAHAVLALDPAATSLTEVIATYPGFYAITIYRLAHQLARVGVPLLPRMLTEYAHSKTGIDIHPAAQIGRSFVIDHGTGVVIGATARIGDHATLYHGVTLGALQVKKSDAGIKRHPTVEDHVTIYANATVLGGETVIGAHSVIGGNVWVTRSVPPNSRLYYKGGASVSSPKASIQNHTKAQVNRPNPWATLRDFYQQVVAVIGNLRLDEPFTRIKL